MCTGHGYTPIYTVNYKYIPVHPSSYKYIPACTRTYWYILVHTVTYQYIPVHTVHTWVQKLCKPISNPRSSAYYSHAFPLHCKSTDTKYRMYIIPMFMPVFLPVYLALDVGSTAPVPLHPRLRPWRPPPGSGLASHDSPPLSPTAGWVQLMSTRCSVQNADNSESGSTSASASARPLAECVGPAFQLNPLKQKKY